MYHDPVYTDHKTNATIGIWCQQFMDQSLCIFPKALKAQTLPPFEIVPSYTSCVLINGMANTLPPLGPDGWCHWQGWLPHIEGVTKSTQPPHRPCMTSKVATMFDDILSSSFTLSDDVDDLDLGHCFTGKGLQYRMPEVPFPGQ